jgi:Spy/CpxP family protein refolding chaperone
MKKAILLAACLFTATATINAQEAPKKPKTERVPGQKGEQKMPAEQRAQKNVDKLNAEVTLSEDQKSKIHTLALDHANKADAIRLKYKEQPENKEIAQKELEVVKKEYRQSVKALLTPEQLEKVKAKNKEMKAAKGAKPIENNVIDAND